MPALRGVSEDGATIMPCTMVRRSGLTIGRRRFFAHTPGPANTWRGLMPMGHERELEVGRGETGPGAHERRRLGHVRRQRSLPEDGVAGDAGQ